MLFWEADTSMLVLHLFLALAWLAITGELTPGNFVAGFTLAYLLLWVMRHILGCQNYVRRVWDTAGLVVYVIWEVILSGLRVAYDVVTPRLHVRPGIIAVPLAAENDLEIFILASLVTLTPGTLSLDVSSDRKTLYVHEMYITDPDEARRKIKEGMEQRLLKVLR